MEFLSFVLSVMLSESKHLAQWAMRSFAGAQDDKNEWDDKLALDDKEGAISFCYLDKLKVQYLGIN